jgi:hypothetical protein
MSPAYSWVGVGIGEKMAGALMFIMYADEDDIGKLFRRLLESLYLIIADTGKGVTISPRIAT